MGASEEVILVVFGVAERARRGVLEAHHLLRCFGRKSTRGEFDSELVSRGLCFEGATAAFPVDGVGSEIGVGALIAEVGVVGFGVEAVEDLGFEAGGYRGSLEVELNR